MTEKEIIQEAEERYLFPTVEYDDYNSVNAFVDGAKWAIDKLKTQMTEWLSEHVEKDTSIIASGLVSVGFNRLLNNFEKQFSNECDARFINEEKHTL